jgi:hypothetical protein
MFTKQPDTNEATTKMGSHGKLSMRSPRGHVVGGAVEGRRRRKTEGRAQMLALAGVLLLLGAAETAREIADTEPEESMVSDLGYALAEALLEVYIVAGEALVVGGLIYLLSYLRGRRRVTFLEEIFNWAVVAAAAVLTLLIVTGVLSI